MTFRKQAIQWAAIGLIPLALMACSPKQDAQQGSAGSSGTTQSPFKSIDLTGADYAKGFALKDGDGKVETLADFKGQPVAVFFGFTQCPDVCPTSMVKLKETKKILNAEGKNLQVVFITLDPARDTPEVLREYTKNFDPAFVALHGDADETDATAKAFKVYYSKVPGSKEGQYTIDHTAAIYIFDKNGNIRLFAKNDITPANLAKDISLL